MRPAGRFVAEVLAALTERAGVGVNLLELDELAHKMIRDRGAESCYIDYHPSFGGSPFGHVICTSVNDAALHGLPHDYKLKDGDLLSLDFAASVNGWVADSAVSLVVGTPRDEDLKLIATVERALAAGIAAAKPGNKIGDISAAIGDIAHAAGLSVNTDFGGPGLVFAIEPWLMLGTDEIYTDKDGWTLRSADGSRAAHAEHTVAVTDDGPV